MAISASTFQAEFCMPMKMVEAFERKTLKEYGQVAESFPPLARILRMLVTEQGRQRCLVCAKDRVPLGGMPGNKGAPGIEEVRTVLDELAKLKAAPAGSGGVPPAEVGGGGMPPAETEDGGLPRDGPEEVASSDEEVGGAGSAEADPLARRLQILSERELSHIAVHESADGFRADVVARTYSTQLLLAFIDSPTSKMKVFTDLVKTLSTFDTERLSIFIPVGRRFEVLAGLMPLLRERFPKHTAFTVVLEASDIQTARLAPTFAVWLPAPAAGPVTVPTTVRANACRANAWECLRLRCTRADCPLRPAGERPVEACPSEPPNPGAELPDDDMADTAGDENLAVEEAEDADGPLAEDSQEVGDAPGEGKRYLVDLFPFSRPISHYSEILTKICLADRHAHLLALSRTSHPSLLIAGREAGLEVFSLMHGLRQHGLAHGRALLESIVRRRCRPRAAEEVGDVGAKRQRVADIQTIVARAPDEQVVRVRDVVISGVWTEGIDRNPGDIAAKARALTTKETKEHQLTVSQQQPGLCLVTERPLKEGQVVCPVSAVFFSSMAHVEQFLGVGANADFAGRVVRIENLLDADDRRGCRSAQRPQGTQDSAIQKHTPWQPQQKRKLNRRADHITLQINKRTRLSLCGDGGRRPVLAALLGRPARGGKLRPGCRPFGRGEVGPLAGACEDAQWGWSGARGHPGGELRRGV